MQLSMQGMGTAGPHAGHSAGRWQRERVVDLSYARVSVSLLEAKAALSDGCRRSLWICGVVSAAAERRTGQPNFCFYCLRHSIRLLPCDVPISPCLGLGSISHAISHKHDRSVRQLDVILYFSLLLYVFPLKIDLYILYEFY